MEFRPIFLSLKKQKVIAILIVVQVALTMAVLSNSILVTTGTLKEWNLPSGLEHQKIVSAQPTFFDQNVDVAQSISDDMSRIRAISGVTHVTPTNEHPFGARNVSDVYLTATEHAQAFKTNIFHFNEQGTTVLGLSLISGRFFTKDDVATGAQNDLVEPSTVMLSQDMAKALFGNESAIGKTVWLAKGSNPAQVIGIYSNFMNGERLNGMGMSYHSMIRPLVTWQKGNDPAYLIRTDVNNANTLLEDVSDALYQTEGRYVNRVETLTRAQKRMYDGRGSEALTFMVISILLVIITGLGLAGLMSFTINQRRKQVGTRRALGATKWDIMRYFLLENTLVTGAGLLIGSIFSMLLVIEIAEQAGESFLNIGYVLLTALFLFLVNTLAVYLPVQKAANIAPAMVTRSS